MAVAWPSTLPAPLRAGLTVTPNPDVKTRITQSGRKELRRWGKGGGDTLTCTLRLWNNHPAHGDQVATFKRYWSRDLNMGLNWINADWLETGLGYAACYLRIIGYSQRRAVGTLYSDYAVSFNIRTVASAWADTEWLSEGTGGGGTPVQTGGPVVVWGNTGNQASSFLTGVPSGQRGVKAVILPNGTYGGPCGVVLEQYGTVVTFGANSGLEAAASLGEIVDIAGSANGFYYIGSGGHIGHIGTVVPGTGYPTGGRYTKIWCQGSVALAQGPTGVVEFWSSISHVPPATIYNPKFVDSGAIGELGQLSIVDSSGDLYSLTVSLASGANARIGCMLGSLLPSYLYQKEDYTWASNTPTHAIVTGLPGGLVPIHWSTGFYGVLAIHSDGQVFCWPGNGGMPSGLMALYGQRKRAARGRSSGSTSYEDYYIAIQKEE